ncbi:MAG: Spy/CpxP family protein refolding chaperone [Acetobacteraceae bacterium]
MYRPILPTLAAALLLAAAPALAKPAPAHPPAGPAAQVDARVAQLRAELAITPAELPQWNALAGVMHQNADAMQQAWRSRSRDVDHMTAVQILESYRDFARAHVAALDRLVPAFRRLYAVLTPAQRARVDDLFQDRAEKHAGHH